MGKGKICPACHKDLPEGTDTCPFCGFSQLDRIFLDRDDQKVWLRTKLDSCAGRSEPCVFQGEKHRLILEGGALYGIGCNDTGQISDTDQENYAHWIRMQDGVISADAGCNYSIYVTTDGQVHIQGRGIFRERFKGFSGAVRVEADKKRDRFFILDAQGQWFAFGDNRTDIFAPRVKEEVWRPPDRHERTVNYYFEGWAQRLEEKGSFMITRSASGNRLFGEDLSSIYRWICGLDRYKELCARYSSHNLWVDLNAEYTRISEKNIRIAKEDKEDFGKWQEMFAGNPVSYWWAQKDWEMVSPSWIKVSEYWEDYHPVVYRTNEAVFEPIPCERKDGMTDDDD
ncbi:MAG TPA: hypothetical protein IAB63_01665 [Candidatus Onthocola gallistercoris]|uniref:Uncharacterized protein n=1 Tax=Candidatus Onthocola gallistercoris TaxID=2840876 RepID=A0A9D1HGW3_9FIRM|nr:hypothetical protein [Candidatus Onthocola gallistercoris]